MNTETIKQMSEALESLSIFVKRQSEFNKSLTEQVIFLRKRVGKLTKRTEEDNE